LPALVLLLVVGVGAVSAAGTKLRCTAAARDGALSEARGGSGVGEARRTAPDRSTIDVAVTGDLARAVVSSEVNVFGRHLPGIVVSATAVAAVESRQP
jgi:hypothetical protein